MSSDDFVGFKFATTIQYSPNKALIAMTVLTPIPITEFYVKVYVECKVRTEITTRDLQEAIDVYEKM